MEGGIQQSRAELRRDLAALHQELAAGCADSGDAAGCSHHRMQSRGWARLVPMGPATTDMATQCDRNAEYEPPMPTTPQTPEVHAQLQTAGLNPSQALCLAQAELRLLEGCPEDDSVALQARLDDSLGIETPSLSEYRKAQWLRDAMNPSSFAAARNEGLALIARGDAAGACACFQLAAKHARDEEDRTTALSALAHARFSVSDTAGCIAALSDALDTLSSDAPRTHPARHALLCVHILTSLARAYHCDGQTASAVIAFRRALRLLPPRPPAGWTGQGGQAAKGGGEWDAELRFSLLLNCGDSLAALGEFSAAMDNYKKALSESTADGDANRQWAASAKLSQAAYNAGDRELAAKYAVNAIAHARRSGLDSESAELLLQLCRTTPAAADRSGPAETPLHELLRRQRAEGDLERLSPWTKDPLLRARRTSPGKRAAPPTRS